MCLIVWIWNKKTWRLHQSARAYQFHGHVGLGRGYTITFQLWAHGLATRWVGHIGYTMEDASFAGKWYARAHKIELQYYGLALGRNLTYCNLPKLKPQSKANPRCKLQSKQSSLLSSTDCKRSRDSLPTICIDLDHMWHYLDETPNLSPSSDPKPQPNWSPKTPTNLSPIKAQCKHSNAKA